MSYFMNNQQKLNDIIFADRNKAYGAYAIRSEYGITVLRSLGCTILGVGSLALTAYFLTRTDGPDQNNLNGQILTDSIYVIPFTAPEEHAEPAEPAEKKKDPLKPAENNNTQNSTLIVDSVNIETSAEVTNTLAANASSTSIPSGEKTGGSGNSSLTVTSSLTIPGPEIKNAFEVDSPAEFEGGLNALHHFIASNLRYPDWASQEGKEGKVFVKFVIDENGKVGNLSLLNSVGYGMDDEALRVVGLIPKFKSPAKKNGQAVKMYYQLPIRFKFR